MSDLDLLVEYVDAGSEAAFEELVRRHSSLVYSSARRRAGSALADDVTQAVFLILARKAPTLCRRPLSSLAGWLYRATRFAAAEARRTQARRLEREQLAQQFEQESTQERSAAMDTTQRRDAEAEILPLLDEALDRLGRRDREAVLLRFFQNASFAQVGAAMGISENAAAQRVGRALDRIRDFLCRRQNSVASSALMALLAAQAVEAAPATLTTACAGIAGIATGPIAAIAAGAARSMLLVQVKLTALAVAGALAIGAGTLAAANYFTDDGHRLANAIQFVGIEDFPIRYKARSLMPDGSFQFQLNTASEQSTTFAGLGDEIGGFRLLRHEEKHEDRRQFGVGDAQRTDISELVLQRGNRQVVLVKGATAPPSQDCAHVVFRADSIHRQLCAGDELEIGDARFQVVSVDREQSRLSLRRLPDGREVVLSPTRE
jgi:RNA polymerase sigma factor (sigma-70 family)